MTCESCGNQNAYRFSCSSTGRAGCDKCSQEMSTFKFSDVYFKKPYFDPNIAHDTKAPMGTFIQSRQHKAECMKRLGLRESGDRHHGTR